jgi:hypothetical protein
MVQKYAIFQRKGSILEILTFLFILIGNKNRVISKNVLAGHLSEA